MAIDRWRGFGVETAIAFAMSFVFAPIGHFVQRAYIESAGVPLVMQSPSELVVTSFVLALAFAAPALLSWLIDAVFRASFGRPSPLEVASMFVVPLLFTALGVVWQALWIRAAFAQEMPGGIQRMIAVSSLELGPTGFRWALGGGILVVTSLILMR